MCRIDWNCHSSDYVAAPQLFSPFFKSICAAPIAVAILVFMLSLLSPATAVFYFVSYKQERHND